jgi:hypothetical protein
LGGAEVTEDFQRLPQMAFGLNDAAGGLGAPA